MRLVFALSTLAAVAGCSGGSAPAPTSPATEPSAPITAVADVSRADATAAAPTFDAFLRALCPSPVTRETGTWASVIATSDEMAAAPDLETVRAILCRSTTTERAFAHLLHSYATAQYNTGDVPGAVTTFEVAAREYGEHWSLMELAIIHYYGPASRLPGTRDLGAAYCEAWAAMSISRSLLAIHGDRSLHTRVVSALLGIVDSYEASEIAVEWSSAQHEAESQACIAAHIARYEAHFGHLTTDHEANEAALATARLREPSLDHLMLCPCDQLVETADGPSCPSVIEWSRTRPAEMCATYRTHAPASDDEALTFELMLSSPRGWDRLETREIEAGTGRAGAARNLVLRFAAPDREVRALLRSPSFRISEQEDATPGSGATSVPLGALR